MTKLTLVGRIACYKVILFVQLLLLFGIQHAFSQVAPAANSVIVSGVIKDGGDGKPLGAVTIEIAGTKQSDQSNEDGKFLIHALPGATLTFRSVGYLPKDYKVTGSISNLIITLKQDPKEMKDVVVIGYQSLARRNVSAAVTSLDPKTIADVPSPTLDGLLQGRVAGVNVQNFSGEPGIRSTVVVRGNTSVSRSVNNDPTTAAGKASLARAVSGPLYVIDGVPQATDDIAAINYGNGTNTDVLAGIPVSDIESIDILKDASASAIYGSRGAGGVIIIKTKKGTPGRLRINFSTYHGITERPTLDKVYIGAEETRAKMDLINHYGPYNSLTDLPMILTDTLNPAFNNANDYRGGMFQTGLVDNVDLSVSGGSDVVNYRYGLNYYNEKGIIKKSGLQRYSFNSNTSVKLSSKLTVNTQIRFSHLNRPRSLNDITGGYGPFNGGYYASSRLPASTLYLSPTSRDFIFGNASNQTDANTNNSLTISPSIDWKISNKLAFNTVISFQTANSRRDTYSPGKYRQSGVGYAVSFADNSANYLMSNTLMYTTAIGNNHHLNFLLGQNTEFHQYRSTDVETDGIPNDQVAVVNILNKNQSSGFSDLIESGIQSGFFRLNYDFKGRYLFSGVFNADASSKFGSNNRVGYFPSVSAGWIVSEEPFMDGFSGWLSLLKIRGSFGVTGRQPDDGSNYLSYNTYTIGAGSFAGSNNPANNQNISFTYNGVPAISPNFSAGLANKNLTWEHSQEANLGIDINILNGRFNLVTDLYVRNTKQGIFSLVLPVTTGFSTITTNAIGTRNSGIETQLSAHWFKPASKFQWSTDFNFAYNKNMVTSLPNGGRDIVVNQGATSYLLRQGHPINEYFLFQATGVYKTDKDVPFNPLTGAVLNFYGYPFRGGDPIWKDQNGDGILDNTDYAPAGNPNPKFTGGFNNTFSYRNLSLTVFCTYTLGRQIYNDYLAGRLSGLVPTDDGDPNPLHAISHNALPDLGDINYWRNPGDNATYPSLSSFLGTRYKYAAVSSQWVENGDYMRIKTMTLSYVFNRSVLQRLHLGRLRVYGMVDNLHIFQKALAPDAEQVDPFGIYNGSGYPIPKKFTLGLDMSL
jgi:TonB-linked SusC/RagA family outer membrane protein